MTSIGCLPPPLYGIVLRETEQMCYPMWDNMPDGVASQFETDNMRAARIGATPPVRAARHSGVDE